MAASMPACCDAGARRTATVAAVVRRRRKRAPFIRSPLGRGGDEQLKIDRRVAPERDRELLKCAKKRAIAYEISRLLFNSLKTYPTSPYLPHAKLATRRLLS